MNNLKWVFKDLKFAWQRAVRGYDDRIEKGWGAEILILNALPGIKKFCKRQLALENIDEGRAKIFRKTIKLIDDGNDIDGIVRYICKNIGIYWD